MMKTMLPILISTTILYNPRAWLLLPMIFTLMTLTSLFLHPIFHASSPSYLFYIDSLNAPLITLTLWVSSLMPLASQKLLYNHHSPKKFLLVISLLLLFLILTFLMNNLMTFYIFFEASLIPTFILVLGWGYQPERLQASMYLLLYTITASLPLLLMTLLLTTMNSPTFMPMISKPLITLTPVATIWWLLMLLAFMVKMPMYSMHLWLPKAHVEAPVAGSMILASILLKLGSYAMIRVSSMFPSMNLLINSLIMPIAMLGGIFTSMICLRQTDLKALIAYSSVGHMGLLIAGALTNSQWGWQGSLVMMISHGLTSSALFVMANSIYETTQTRSLFLTKGLLSMFPPITLMFFILTASNMAAPPTINLLGEIALITPTLSFSPQMITPVVFLTFLSTAYSLHMYASTNHGHPPIFFNPHYMFNLRNFNTPLLHTLPSTMLILKMDMMNPWI